MSFIGMRILQWVGANVHSSAFKIFVIYLVTVLQRLTGHASLGDTLFFVLEPKLGGKV